MTLSGQTPAPVIDVHAHAVLPMSIGAAGAAGPELGTDADGVPFYRVGDYRLVGVRYEGSPFMDVDLRLAAMDAAGIDRQLLSPNPITYFTDLSAPEAVEYARAHNLAMAELVARHPDRLLGAAQLPVQDVPAAIEELHRCLDAGLVAPYLDTDPARRLDDPALDPLYEAITARDVPLFLHPSPLGTINAGQDDRLRRFDLDLLLGFAYDETLAVAALVFGGVLDRHPDLDVCLSHGGGVLAFVAGRFARAVAKPRAWVPEHLREHGLDRYLRRLWFDTHVHAEGSLQLLIDRVGTDRLVFGTNFAGWDDTGAEAVAEVGTLMPTLSANARRLLRLE